MFSKVNYTRPLRRIRHWKQKFNRNSIFVWSKNAIYDNKKVSISQPIPEKLRQQPIMLENLWESGYIQIKHYGDSIGASIDRP